MRSPAWFFLSLAVVLSPSCKRHIDMCGCDDDCLSEETSVSLGDALGWTEAGTAGASGAGGESAGSVGDFLRSIEGDHETTARYLYDESLPHAEVTIRIENLEDATLIDYEAGEYCEEDRIRFSALIGLATSDGRFDESATGTGFLTKSGDFSVVFEMNTSQIQGDFDPAAIESLGDGDHEMSVRLSFYFGDFHGEISIQGPTRDPGDGVGSSSRAMVLIIPAVED
jgi:hypothetical protein